MTIVITLPRISERQKQAAEEYLAWASLHVPDFNGANFEVQTGDALVIEDQDELRGQALFNTLRGVIDYA